jgi:hypothetical protein
VIATVTFWDVAARSSAVNGEMSGAILSGSGMAICAAAFKILLDNSNIRLRKIIRARICVLSKVVY